MFIIAKMVHIIQHCIEGKGINMSNWKKIKIISLVVLLVVITLLVIIFVNNRNHFNNIPDSMKTESNRMLNMDNDFINIVYFTAKKNSDWTNLPLSNKFRNKYNPQNGILNDDEITNISGGGDSDKDKQIVVLNIFHNSKKEEYHIHYILNEQNELDDVEIVNKKLLYDENGKEVIEKETMDGAFDSNIVLLAAPDRLEYNPFDYVYVTENYLKKWRPGFIDYDISCGIEPISGLENKEKQIVYLYVVQDKFDENGTIIGDEWEKYFRIHYFVDENMYLDDVEVEEVSKDEIDRLLASIN